MAVPRFALVLVVLLSAGCHSVANPKDLGSVSITLERTRCEGIRPAYTVTIDGKGRAQYMGNFYVDIPGRQRANIQSQEIKQLLKSVAAIRLFTLKDEYFENCTDLATEIISVSVDGKSKRVSNYFGCGTVKSGPQVDLDNLSKEIDPVAGVSRWIKCDYKCLQEQVRNGLNVNGQGPDGRTVLIAAIGRGDLAAVRLLLDSGAQINVADDGGLTPLMHAVMWNRPEMLRELLARGADVNATDKEGFTVLGMTAKGWPMREMLIKAGAKYERLPAAESR